MKTPKTKRGCVNGILNLLFMKESSIAEHALRRIVDNGSQYGEIYDNPTKLRFDLYKHSLKDLRKDLELAVLVADATHCDELNRADEKMAPKKP